MTAHTEAIRPFDPARSSFKSRSRAAVQPELAIRPSKCDGPLGCILNGSGFQNAAEVIPARGKIHMSPRTARFFLIAAGCVFVAAAQSQPQAYVVDTCVKAAPGKGLETSA